MKNDEFRCPGQNSMFWKPDDIYEVTCPNCGRPVEFWKDDAKRTCGCGHRFLNPKRDIGCLEWCKYAEKCMPEMFQGENLRALYRDRLLATIKAAVRPEEKRLERTMEVLELADEIFMEEGGEPKVVIAAVILRALMGSSSPGSASGDGSPQANDDCGIARKILSQVDTEPEVIDEVCQIIQGASGETSSANANLQIVSDAENIVNLRDKRALLEGPALERLVEEKLVTESGRTLARELLL